MSEPTLDDILFSPCLGPHIILMLPLRQKRDTLKAMYQVDPGLVKFYLRLLWSNPWTWNGPYCTHRVTGYYQEVAPYLGDWPYIRELDINDI